MPAGYASVPFNSLLDEARRRLLEIANKPRGPSAVVAKYRPRIRGALPVRWEALFDWDRAPRSYRQGLQPVEQHLRDLIEDSLRKSIIQDVLFAAGSRDFESLNLGLLWIDGTGPASVEEQATGSVIRMLAQRRRWTGSDAEGQTQPPSYISNYLVAVALRAGQNPITLQTDVETRLGQQITQWLVRPETTFVLTPRPDATQLVATYQCARCGRSHLHPSGGVCTTCLRPLPEVPTLVRVDTEPTDFYEYLARTEALPFRLNCEELTGQTNGEDRITRQRRFQDVFLDNESVAAAGIDLLSVTTTMEAGVDIGALQAISLANMPPVRFNYQQRVGRAGRRGLGMSAVLTLCRGRSHDDYYFERPRLITAEPPPTPYVDVSREEIAKRVVNKEVLRRALREIGLPAGGDNVHGEFGRVDEWPQLRSVVQAWIAGHPDAVASVCEAILRKTPMESAVGREGMARHVRESLIHEIDSVAQHRESLGHLALSERLASMGILPMFGFPTRVRYLYHERPTLTHGWPPERGVIWTGSWTS